MVCFHPGMVGQQFQTVVFSKRENTGTELVNIIIHGNYALRSSFYKWNPKDGFFPLCLHTEKPWIEWQLREMF